MPATTSSQTYATLMSYAGAYQIFLIVNCVIICLLYPLFILSVIYSDKKLNIAYKCLFFCCATTSLSKSIMQALFAPILTPTFFGVIVTGVAKDLGPDTNLWFFQLALVMLTNSMLCTVALLIFQFSHLTPNCMWSKLGKNTTILMLSHFAYMSAMISVALIIIRLARNSRNDFHLYAYMTDNAFAKELLASGETYFTFIAKYNSTSYAFATIALASTFFLCFVGFYYTWILSKVIAKTRDLVSEQTYKLEMVMFRTFIFKTGMMIGFYLIPLLVYAITVWADIESPLICILTNVVCVSHGCISYVIGFFFIGPYRVISKLIKRKISSYSSSVTPSDTRTLSNKIATHNNSSN